MVCAEPVDSGLRGSWFFFLVQLFSPICSHLDLEESQDSTSTWKKRKECFLAFGFQSASLIAAEESLAILKVVCHLTTQSVSLTHKSFCLSLVTSAVALVFGLWSVARVYFPGWDLATFGWCLACAALLLIHVIVKQEIPMKLLSSCVEQNPGELQHSCFCSHTSFSELSTKHMCLLISQHTCVIGITLCDFSFFG